MALNRDIDRQEMPTADSDSMTTLHRHAVIT